MRQLALRLPTLLLATLYVAGNFGLPASDLLLNHALGEPYHEVRSHFEGRAGCHDHADHCVLNRLLNESRLQTRASAAVQLAAVPRRLVVDADPGRTAGHPRYLPHQSRAPPSPLA